MNVYMTTRVTANVTRFVDIGSHRLATVSVTDSYELTVSQPMGARRNSLLDVPKESFIPSTDESASRMDESYYLWH